MLASPNPAHAAPCSGSQLQGSVFHDYDASGTRGAGNTETGVAGAVVTAFANDGTSASCETLADGGFGIDPPASGFPVRVEVTLPNGWPYDALEPGASGLTTVFFAAGPATGLDVGLNVPGDFCQANPDVMATCFLQGDPLFVGSDAADGDTIVSVDYDRTVASPIELAVGGEVGAVWGLAYQRSSDRLFAAAVLRRHAGTGPLGLGGIYRIDDPSGTPVVSNFIDVSTLGVPVGTDPRTQPGEDPPGNGPTGNEPGLDNLTYEEVGKVGLGDLDLDEETGTLWVMSLADGNLYSMVIGAAGNVPASATRHELPTVSCTDGVFRPWAVKSYRGRIFVGGVCSNENISPYPPEGGFIDFPNLEARVYSLDLVSNSFALELTIPLNYPKGCSGGTTGCQWYPWTDLSTASLVGTPSLPSHPTPMFSDIEFADDGDMILGFTDRTGFQYGVQSPSPNSNPSDTTVVTVFAGGDMLRADFVPSSGFTLESNGIVGGVAGAGSGNAQGPGGGEYYSASTSNFHFELSQGGYAVLRGSNEFLGSSMDPLTLDSGGLLWMHELGATPGAQSAGYTLYQDLGPPTFAKGAGIGDVELRCEAAPLEIGNRVWCDAPSAGVAGDGIQGPGAPDVPLAGVTVNLSCNGGAVTASTLTQADGTYLFDASNVAGGLPFGADCTVSIDSSQAALGACNLPTVANAGGADAGADLRDSDGLDPDADGIVEVAVTLGGPGENDHSIDFGFTVLQNIGSIGDTVWCDGFVGAGNGVFDAGEGVAGVTVGLYEDVGCNGTADGPGFGSQETAGDGQYLFTGLPVGPVGNPVCYVVRVDPFDVDLGSCNQSITPTETQPDLDVDNPSNLDNDFGFEEPLGDIGVIGDTVWCDGFVGAGNGVFDAGEGVAGVTVGLYEDVGCNGTADGPGFGSQETAGDGQYLFTGLPIGPVGNPVCYVVRVDGSDPDLGSCNLPITPLEYQPDLDVDNPSNLDNDFGFEEPLEDIGVIGDTVWCDGFEGTGNGTFDPGEGVGGVTVSLFEDAGCNGTADTPLGTRQTTGVGEYLFTGLPIGPPGDPVCYVVRVDGSDADLGSCNLPITPLEYQPDLDLDNPEDLDNDFGFEEPLEDIGVIGDTVWCDGLMGFGNGTFDAGEGVAGITVSLFGDADCNDVADGGAIDTRETAGDGQYLFTGLPIGPPGNPVCYVVRVDASDTDLGSCNQPITPIETRPDLDLDNPEDPDNDYGFEEPCVDGDGDGICNESCVEDRDGDGEPDCSDFDPQGYFYCEDTGEILTGGSIDVVGPGSVDLIEDGSGGRYTFLTDGTPGEYTLMVNAPQNLPMSDRCFDQGVLDPSGNPDPLVLGAGQNLETPFLTDNRCSANPFYLTFELEPGDPFVINNNLPFGSCGPPPTEIPTLSGWGIFSLVLLLGGLGLQALRRLKRREPEA